jgi:hypothetical protein
MAAELEKLAKDLEAKGFNQGAQILRGVRQGLKKAELIPNSLAEETKPEKRLRFFNAVRHDVATGEKFGIKYKEVEGNTVEIVEKIEPGISAIAKEEEYFNSSMGSELIDPPMRDFPSSGKRHPKI